ncbi:MAG: hypothetical protein JNK05_13955 [Myxococcales bacterium]|nr:hypothetical protein [Myxococcales bacterium]
MRLVALVGVSLVCVVGCGRVGYVPLDAQQSLTDRAVADRPAPVDARDNDGSPDAMDASDASDGAAIEDAMDAAPTDAPDARPADAAEVSDAADAASDTTDATNGADAANGTDVTDASDVADARTDARSDPPSDVVPVSLDATTPPTCDTAARFSAPLSYRSTTCGAPSRLVPACAGVEAPTSYVAIAVPAGRDVQVTVSPGFAIEHQDPCGVTRRSCSTSMLLLAADARDTVFYLAVASTTRAACGEFTLTAR